MLAGDDGSQALLRLRDMGQRYVGGVSTYHAAALEGRAATASNTVTR